MRPVQAPDDTLPLMTSQYLPAASDVVKVEDQAESTLLMATKPADPMLSFNDATTIGEEERTSPERNLLRLGRNPVREGGRSHSVTEADHTRYSDEAMLA